MKVRSAKPLSNYCWAALIIAAMANNSIAAPCFYAAFFPSDQINLRADTA